MSTTEMAPPDSEPRGKDQARKSVENVVASAGVCAFGALVLGAFFDAAWPGAVTACGISLMGSVVSFCLIKYS